MPVARLPLTAALGKENALFSRREFYHVRVGRCFWFSLLIAQNLTIRFCQLHPSILNPRVDMNWVTL